MSWEGQEKRQAKRYAIKGITVRYRKGRLLSFLRPPSPRYLLLNFSQTGCHFITRDALEPGDRLRLSIEAPKMRGSIGAFAKVVWCRKSQELNAYRVGVRFASLKARSRLLLKNLLDSAILENVEISTKVYLKEIERL